MEFLYGMVKYAKISTLHKYPLYTVYFFPFIHIGCLEDQKVLPCWPCTAWCQSCHYGQGPKITTCWSIRRGIMSTCCTHENTCFKILRFTEIWFAVFYLSFKQHLYILWQDNCLMDIFRCIYYTIGF